MSAVRCIPAKLRGDDFGGKQPQADFLRLKNRTLSRGFESTVEGP